MRIQKQSKKVIDKITFLPFQKGIKNENRNAVSQSTTTIDNKIIQYFKKFANFALTVSEY